MARRKADDEKQVLGFLGVGLDGKAGEQRLTRTENFFLVGGSEETHERMQDATIRFNEFLRMAEGIAYYLRRPTIVCEKMAEADAKGELTNYIGTSLYGSPRHPGNTGVKPCLRMSL